MIYNAKEFEHLFIYSMGKRFRVTAIATTADEANALAAKTGNDEHLIIAELGPFIFMAEKYPLTERTTP